MGCTKRFLMFKWERHHWVRRVSGTFTETETQPDMWGRQVDTDYVLCHAQYVCTECGAVRDGEECGCDPERADQCPARLAHLNKVADAQPGGTV